MSSPNVELADLRVGDLLLLEPGTNPKLVSTVVTDLDGGRCSHAVLVDTLAPDFYTISANHESDKFASGVNAIALSVLVGDPHNLRAARVLRHRGGAGLGAVETARRYVERAVPPLPERYPGTGRDSQFGWDHLVISAFAALARHLEPGSAPRRLVYSAAVALSRGLLHGDPCTVEGPGHTEVPWEWDCCHFVDHCFCEAGAPLGIVESDPHPREGLSTVFDCLRRVVDHLDDGIDGDELPEPFDDEPAIAGRRDFVRLATRVGDRLGVGLGDVLAARHHTAPGDPVWPPFVSPRLLTESPAFDDLGWLRRAAFGGAG